MTFEYEAKHLVGTLMRRTDVPTPELNRLVAQFYIVESAPSNEVIARVMHSLEHKYGRIDA
jgi:hypothetical protein